MTRPDDTRAVAPNIPIAPGVSVAPVRVVFCGMTGAFSLLALEGLLRGNVTLVAVVLPALRERTGPPLLPRPSSPRGVAVPMLTAAPMRRTILDVAAERNVPVLELGNPDVPATLARLTFDAICVACFSRRLPAWLLRLPRLGCLNVHPSLLPAHRGPDPLFWVFHDGDELGGVTVHLMDEGLDTGPIVLQETLSLPDDLTETALERRCAERGGVLLAEALSALDAGEIQPQPQDTARATYQSWPTEDDYTVTPAWSARWAYRFLTGISGRGDPLRFAADDATFTVRAALGYDEGAMLDVPWRLTGDTGDTLEIQCAPGVLRCQIER